MSQLLPNLDNISINTDVTFASMPGKTWYYDKNSGRLIAFTDGLTALAQSVEVILTTERYLWQIYSANFGTKLKDLPGQSYLYITSELKRRIADALSPDDRISGVGNFTFDYDTDTSSLVVEFVIYSVYGNFPKTMEVTA